MMLRAAAIALVACALAACSGDDAVRPVAELMQPETCMECHPKHFTEWSGSMHAYASDDPVFLAMNKLGQEQTGGQLGSFCVQCHAPMALRQGLTTDGTNLADVPQWAKGVTCYFCHDAVQVTDDHNNPVVLADDQTMRASYKNAVHSPAHHTAYSAMLDSRKPESVPLCGSCHDIVTPAGVHLERTYAEWQTTIFADTTQPAPGIPPPFLACGACHMVGSSDVIAEGAGLDVPLRVRREHTFAGVDVALTDWPEKTAQLAAINRDLKGALKNKMCVQPDQGGQISVELDNVGSAHFWPSGATQDRRAWVEVVAYDAGGQVLFSSGVIPAATPGADPESIGDPNLWIMGTPTTDAGGAPSDLFWQITTIDHPGTLSKPAVTTDISDPRFYHATKRFFPVTGMLPQIARITARVLIRPLPTQLVDELHASGHLAMDLRAMVPTHELMGTRLEWHAGDPICIP